MSYRRATGRFVWSLGVVALIVLSSRIGKTAERDAVPRAIWNYVEKPDDVFGWKIAGERQVGEGRVYEVDLVSQRWQDITWRHVLLICEPARIEHPHHVLLFITGGRNGGRPGEGDMAMGLGLARMTKSRVAVLHQVPNQPLLGDHVEDDLITETWLKYLETGDETWPLLFPMVKSAVRAMDAIQEIGQQKWQTKIEGFVTTGGSKRGWTSWLTPVVDKRVIATAPIVIDVLNFRPQMQHQKDTWGEFSEQIRDYTSKGLINLGEETPRELQLRRMMDPYTYRSLLSLPKLLVNGTNDRYWVVDAMRFYWDDLVGPKYVLQVPNAGHGLDGGRDKALATVAVFFRHAASGRSMPAVSWSRTRKGNRVVLRMTSDTAPRAARLWTARSATKDFRESRWSDESLRRDGSEFVGEVALPESGYVAHFGEFVYEFDGIPFSLCTLVQRD